MASEKKADVKYTEILDIPQVTISEAEAHLRLSLDSNQHRGAVILVGESGLGKTQIVQQIAESTGRRLAMLNLAQFLTMGAGVPQRTETGHFTIAVPDFFPKPGEKAILFCDEVNQGAPHSLAMFYNLIEDRRLYNYVLPDDCLIVGAMNPSGGSYAVSAIERSPAFRRRVKFMYVISDFRGWLGHAASTAFHNGSKGPAKGKACHPNVLAFIRAHPSALYDGRARDAGKQYTCPATVETVSEDCWNMLANCAHALDSDFAHTRFASSIGNAMATQLCEYIRDSSTTIGADEVLTKYKTVQEKVIQLRDNSGQAQLADLSTNVVQLMFATTPDVEKTADNFLAFLRDLPRDQMASVCTSLRTVASNTNSMVYFRQFIIELNGRPDWCAIQQDMDQTHRSIADSLPA
jgi:hypothetical protein